MSGCNNDVISKVMDVVAFSIDYITEDEDVPCWPPFFIHCIPEGHVNITGYSDHCYYIQRDWVVVVAGCADLSTDDALRSFVASLMKAITNYMSSASVMGNGTLKLDRSDMFNRYMEFER